MVITPGGVSPKKRTRTVVKDTLNAAEKSPKRDKKGIIGVGFVVLANLAEILSSATKLEAAVTDLAGTDLTEVTRYAITTTLAVGYLLSIAWLWKCLFSVRRSHFASALPCVLFLTVGSIGIYNVNMTLHHHDRDWQNAIPAWQKKIFTVQESTRAAKGRGFRIVVENPSAPPQVLTTAQCIVALLEAALDTRRQITAEEQASIRDAFFFIESNREGNSTSPSSHRDSPSDLPNSLSQSAQPNDEGWGFFGASVPTVTEIASWVVMAKVYSLRAGSIWTDQVSTRSLLTGIVRDLQDIAA
jgi:hypothetical protein